MAALKTISSLKRERYIIFFQINPFAVIGKNRNLNFSRPLIQCWRHDTLIRMTIQICSSFCCWKRSLR